MRHASVLLLLLALSGCGELRDRDARTPVPSARSEGAPRRQAPPAPSGDAIGFPREPEPARPPGERRRALPSDLYVAQRTVLARVPALASALPRVREDARQQRSRSACSPLERLVDRHARERTSAFYSAMYVHCFSRTDLLIAVAAVRRCADALAAQRAAVPGGRACASQTVIALGSQAGLLLEAAADLDAEDNVALLRPTCELLVEEPEEDIGTLHDLEVVTSQMLTATAARDEHGQLTLLDAAIALSRRLDPAPARERQRLLARHCR